MRISGITRRARLHRQVAQALEEQCGDEPGERLGELASHWAAAVVSTDIAKAMHYARRAAERALEQLGPDEAVRWYRQALELHDQAPGGKHSERCELLIGLGEAQRQVGNPVYRETLLDAAGLAQELNDTDRLCRAVLANSRGMSQPDSSRLTPSVSTRSRPQQKFCRRMIRGGRGCSRCWPASFTTPATRRAAGRWPRRPSRWPEPPATRPRSAHTLTNAFQSIWVPDKLQERQRLADEVVELAQRLDDPRLSFFAAGTAA